VQASLLIVDSIATNRVALKVKLAAAWYEVHTASTGEDALARVADLMPNLVIVNNTLPDMHVAELSARLKALLGQAKPPLLALTEQDNSREPLLRSGVEDVLPLNVDDRLLVARIRAVLRASAYEAEWRLREGTTRALGFAEPALQFDRPVPVVHMMSATEKPSNRWLDLSGEPGLSVSTMPLEAAMRNLSDTSNASVLLMELPRTNPEAALSVLSDLRANTQTRHKAIFVSVPEGRFDLAAQALDLGADDVTIGSLPASEMSLRARRLHTRREINDSLRATVKNGVEAAIRDPLTGLYNRRYALPHLERIAEQARLSTRPYAVMIADLDHFKRINDWYGHEAGDAVLVECARRMLRNMRAVDLVARIGGEEFLIVLPATGHAAARQAALRLCKRISETPIKVPGRDLDVDVTVSIGLALSDIGAGTPADSLPSFQAPDEMLNRADRALYRAKEMGRNRFMLERSSQAA
jgi:two-component system cell cycle response regulator